MKTKISKEIKFDAKTEWKAFIEYLNENKDGISSISFDDGEWSDGSIEIITKDLEVEIDLSDK